MSTSTLEQSRLALALRRSPIPALRKLTLEESESSVIIQGQVSSYYLKQLRKNPFCRCWTDGNCSTAFKSLPLWRCNPYSPRLAGGVNQPPRQAGGYMGGIYF